MLTWAYMQTGWIQSFSGFFTYFVIMYDFGFLPVTLPGLALKKGYKHRDGDFYDVGNVYNKGNTYVKGCSATGKLLTWPEDPEDGAKAVANPKAIAEALPDWLYLKDLHTDLRMYYLDCVKNTFGEWVV